MTSRAPRVRYQLDPAKGPLRSMEQKNSSKVPGMILFVTVVGVVPLTHSLDSLIGGGWIVSALAAVVIAAILAVNALLLIGK